MKQLWDVMSLIIERFVAWREEQWCNLQLGVVRAQTLQFLELLSGLPESCHTTLAYQSKMSRCNALLIVIPLVKVRCPSAAASNSQLSPWLLNIVPLYPIFLCAPPVFEPRAPKPALPGVCLQSAATLPTV